MNNPTPPVILTLAPHDPTGCSGVSADIQTAVSLGCHPAAVVTALAARDTRELKDSLSVDTALVIEQARALLEDMPVAAIKVGELAEVEHCEAIHSILKDYPRIPVVLDLSAQRAGIHRPGIMQAMRALLLPLTRLLCANTHDLQQLAPEGDTLDAKANLLMETGCQAIQVSRCRHSRQACINRLYSRTEPAREFEWGSGCPKPETLLGANATLSSACAAYLAHGSSVQQAVQQAQQFAWQAYANAQRVGMGKLVPNRLFWTLDQDTPKRFRH
ncbi:bifunctional hydroxymethylpyrimidine kinase/phosphomethylpyrimidine kinase [Simiduia agarivorans]|uniref:Phosphomethylpyrimidine kinase n=1 Tax=Simiduia agarivorans (strain DSM 21679 / JCM 13881 / BCRC 17597 / SA1) TaxID=1117647 RepID=K4KLH8_SIMAS|nr:bifunctional hydroxymethylpyrimidine kinase/phosphomethylpyrimidine kinase [Simiduia agarivorans]AFU99075.1 phosphomethylpyrimidine kinase [Simiduia agarivorans SA1 = DSM 21679]